MKNRVFLLTLLSLLAAALCAPRMSGAPLRYIFYFIGDGMGMGHVISAQTFNRVALGSDTPLLMTTFPVASASMTYSASSPVTDSAAGGTALATGVKTRNNMVGMAPDTVSVASIATRLQELGWGVGIITSNSPDDATPASFYAHQPARQMYYEIGCDMANSGFDFIGGADLRGLTDKNGNPTDLAQRFDRMAYDLVTGLDGINASNARKKIAVNSDKSLHNSLGYAIDGPTDGYTLPQLTEACLAHLEKWTPDAFFMMVEEGLIDHSAHANDAPANVRQVIAFQDAIKVAYDFYLQHPEETLIVVTADHDTGGMTLGNAAIKYNAYPEVLAPVKISKSKFADRVKSLIESNKDYNWDDMTQLLTDNFGFWSSVALTDAETERLHTLFDEIMAGTGESEKTLYKDFSGFETEVWKIIDDHSGTGWITYSHTGNFVPVYAIGVGANRLGSLNNNIDIPALIYDIAIKSVDEMPMPIMR